MYRLDWVEQLKLGTAAPPRRRDAARVSPTVWTLGYTSLLTDVSSEMVSSILPVYIVLHLRMSPLQYGTIDGLYNGMAVALLALAGGLLADRTRRYKEVAAFGYGLSAMCKLLLIAAGAAWGWLAAIVAIDRAGKGARTAPRDAMISLVTGNGSLASAFAVHRALDAGGSLLGPVLAFGLLARLPDAFDAVWMTSFVCALVGVAVLWLFVDNPRPVGVPALAPIERRSFADASRALLREAIGNRRLLILVGAGVLLSLATMSDGFVYLMLQERSHIAATFFPLFYLATACWYMVLSIPAGRIADRWGRTPVLLAGYSAVGMIYLILLTTGGGIGASLLCLFLFGLHYAATEGVLTAMASTMIPPESRTTGLAFVASCIGFGKMGSSLVFGWIWQVWGAQVALSAFAGALAAAVLTTGAVLSHRVARE